MFLLLSFFAIILMIPLSSPLPQPQFQGIQREKLTAEKYVNFANVPCGQPGASYRKSSPDLVTFRRSKVIGGVPASQGEFPWTASIQDERGVPFCGGFVVSSKYIVTGAHCFIYFMHGLMSQDEVDRMKIVLGAVDLGKPHESHQVVGIKRVIIHEKFSYLYPDFENDIALLEVDKVIDWDAFVQPACVSRGDLGEDFSYEKRTGGVTSSKSRHGVVAGWGLRAENQPDIDWLKDLNQHKVHLPIWRNSECQEAYRKYGIKWNTKESHICAGYPAGLKDTCRGDSGSALITKDVKQKRWITIGLVSGGEGCANPGIPGIYTKISHYIPWMRSHIQGNA